MGGANPPSHPRLALPHAAVGDARGLGHLQRAEPKGDPGPHRLPGGSVRRRQGTFQGINPALGIQAHAALVDRRGTRSASVVSSIESLDGVGGDLPPLVDGARARAQREHPLYALRGEPLASPAPGLIAAMAFQELESGDLQPVLGNPPAAQLQRAAESAVRVDQRPAVSLIASTQHAMRVAAGETLNHPPRVWTSHPPLRRARLPQQARAASDQLVAEATRGLPLPPPAAAERCVRYGIRFRAWQAAIREYRCRGIRSCAARSRGVAISSGPACRRPRSFAS